MADGKVELSLVVPCFNEAPCVEAFVRAVDAAGVGSDARLEVVFVDDGSTDGTLEIVRALAARDPRVRYVSFSRNFGKEAALLAGLRKATGALVATLDADLQDPPALLPEMLRAIREEGYDCVATRRTSREGEPPVRSWFARRFYWLMRHFSDVALVDGARDYRMMTRRVVEAILALPEVNRFTKGIYQWVGFRTKWLEYENIERAMSSVSALLKRYFTGILAESCIVMIVVSLTMMLFGMKTQDAFFIGLIMGVMNVVPYAGPLIGGVMSVFMGVINPIEGMTIGHTVFIIAGSLLIIKGFDDFVLQPTLYSERVKAHPLEIFLVILIAGSLAGIVGMLLAIPSYTVLRVFAKEFFSQFRLVQKLTEKI